MRQWFRNAGSKKYHAAGDEWVETGRALCGRSIARPGYTLTRNASAIPLVERECSDCMRRALAEAK